MSGAPLFTLVIFMKVDNISLMFVLNFVLFFNLFTLAIFMKVDNYFITLLMLVLDFAF